VVHLAFRSSSQWLILSPEIHGMVVPHCGFALLFFEIVRQIDKLDVKQQFFYGSFMINNDKYIYKYVDGDEILGYVGQFSEFTH
jgi:hypothetical protein